MVHVIIGDYSLLRPRIWNTRCGRYYGTGAKSERLASVVGLPRNKVCRACMPDEIARSNGAVFDAPSIDIGTE